MNIDLDIKLNSLKEISKLELSQILNIVPKQKYLVLEPCLIRPLERMCGLQMLKNNGVEKIFKLEPTSPNFGDYPVFYMIFSNLPTFKQVIDQIRSKVNPEKPIKHFFHIIVVPRFFSYYETELEELGMIHDVISLHSFLWFPLHLDTGILSLELLDIYRSVFLKHDYSFLPVMSRSLWRLYFVLGRPKFVLALGEHSNKVVKQIDLLIEDQGDTDKLDSQFGGVLIIDRNVDYPSALLMPGTYTALLSEVYDVKCGICELKESIEHSDTFDGPNRLKVEIKKQPATFALNSTQDIVYADIKSRYFTEVPTVLSTLTKQLKSEKVSSTEMALDQIKLYVQTQLQASKSKKKFISNHLNAAETIINVLGPRYESQHEFELNIIKNINKNDNYNHLEETLCTIDDKYICLRLFCLLCITQKLTENEINSFWRKYIHQFGFCYSMAYRHLINANFISEPTSNTSSKILQSKIRIPGFTSKEFYVNCTKFKQIPPNPEKINLKFPTCASYVFGGCYIPLIVQIASMLLNATPLDEIKTKLTGLGPVTSKNDGDFPMRTRSVLIFMIGGITYAEVAACNLLETLTGSRIILMSDRIITGNDLMKDILH